MTQTKKTSKDHAKFLKELWTKAPLGVKLSFVLLGIAFLGFIALLFAIPEVGLVILFLVGVYALGASIVVAYNFISDYKYYR